MSENQEIVRVGYQGIPFESPTYVVVDVNTKSKAQYMTGIKIDDEIKLVATLNGNARYVPGVEIYKNGMKHDTITAGTMAQFFSNVSCVERTSAI